VLITSVAGPELPRVRRLRSVLSSGSSDEFLAKGYSLILILGDQDIVWIFKYGGSLLKTLKEPDINFLRSL
jgi:esterase/lipase superfamily enzyme